MELGAAQDRIVAAYANGATGVLVSGIVWVVAGLVLQASDPVSAYAALFFGGMLIQPVGLLLARMLPGTSKPAPGNPLDRLGIESIFILFAGLLLGFLLLHESSALVFPAIALAVGARYFLFQTFYGEPLYWGLGALLMALAAAAGFGLPFPGQRLVLVVGIVEIVAAGLLLVRWRRRT